MVHLEIRSNTKELLRGLDDLQRSQFPFAVAAALTATAKAAQTSVRMRTRAVFKLHNDWIPRNIWLKPALKHDIIKHGIAEAVVYTSPLIPYMELQETGGVKTPYSSKKLAIPSYRFQKTFGIIVKRGAVAGSIKSKWSPSSLLANDWRSFPSAYISKDGKAIYLRLRGRGHIMLAYVLLPAANIKARWQFVETAEKVFNRQFERQFLIWMHQAVSTARLEHD